MMKAAAVEASEDYEVLQMVNSSLLSERSDARWWCEDLKNDLKMANADSTTCTLEATIKSIKTHSVEVATAGNKHLNDFEVELSRDLMELRELYIHNICSIGGLCLPMLEGDPSAADYMHWLSWEVGDLPKVFVGMNENFVSAAFEGALMVAGDSIDLDAIQDAVAASGADILPMERDVRRAACAVEKNWWHSFG
jgi:hypothetical protein